LRGYSFINVSTEASPSGNYIMYLVLLQRRGCLEERHKETTF